MNHPDTEPLDPDGMASLPGDEMPGPDELPPIEPSGPPTATSAPWADEV